MQLEYNKVRNQVKNIEEEIWKISITKKQKKIQRPYGATSSQNLKLWTGDLHVDPEDIKSIKMEDNKVNANILSEYFSSVFTKEPEGDVLAAEP